MKKQSSYRPRAANPNAWIIAMQGARKLSIDDQLTRSARVRAAVTACARAQATTNDWREIFDALNMIEALASVGLVKDASEFVQEHQTNIVAILDRKRETGSGTLKASELKLLEDLAATWAEILAVVTHNEYFKAEEKVIRRVASCANGPAIRIVEAA